MKYLVNRPLGIEILSVGSWPFSDPGLVNLSVRCVPEAEVNPGILNVRCGGKSV